MNLIPVLCAACAVVIVPREIFAQPVEQHETVTQLAGEIELARLVDLVAEKLSLNIEYEPSSLRASVTLRLGAGVSDEELWGLTNRLLASHGVTTVRMPGEETLSVVKTGDAASLAAIETRAEFGGSGVVAPGFRRVLVTLDHAAPDEAVMAPIRNVLSGQGAKVEPFGDGASLIVSGLTPRLRPAVALLERLDAPAARVTLEELELEHLRADRLIALVSDINAKQAAVAGRSLSGEILPGSDPSRVFVIAAEAEQAGWAALVGRLDASEPLERSTYVPRYFGVQEVADLIGQLLGEDPERRVVVDDLTGSLIVTTTPKEHAEIESLMQRLDATPVEARRPVRTWVIQNRNVNDVAAVVQSLLASGVLYGFAGEAGLLAPGADPTQPEVPPTEYERRMEALVPGAPSPPGSDLVITVDDGTNTLIAMGPARLLEQVDALIEKIDVRQAQVNLEVLMISLTDNEALDLGIELAGQFEVGATSFSLASLFGLGSPPVSGGGDDPRGAGFTGLALKPGDFAVLVRALETLNEGRTLTRPSILVANNEQATLDAVNQQPTTSINASDTVSTTSFAGFQPAGTQITIRPQIAEGDHLLVEYSVSLSSFDGESSSPGVPPPRNENRVQSVATIPDGYTIVVGGIEVTTRGDAESRVPVLGRMPLVGWLFKNTSTSANRARFYVFIRPTVVRHESFEDLKYLSDNQLAEVGLESDWPTVAPRIIR